MDIRKIVVIRERILEDGGTKTAEPKDKIAVAAVVRDPHPREYVEDLSQYIDFGGELGGLLTRKAAEEFGTENIESFGKGAVVGENCELEHGAAMNHVKFGKEMRRALGFPCRSVIPSAIRRGGPGAAITVPLVHREACLVRSHFDAMTVQLPDAPASDEIVVLAVFSRGGRPLHRLGGLTADGIVGDGLR